MSVVQQEGLQKAQDNVEYLAGFIWAYGQIAQGNPFIPLRIPQSRITDLEELLGASIKASLDGLDAKTRIMGFAYSANQSVVMDFMLAKLLVGNQPVMAPIYQDAPLSPGNDPREPRMQEPLWELRCATIWLKQNDGSYVGQAAADDWTNNASIGANVLLTDAERGIIRAGLLPQDLLSIAEQDKVDYAARQAAVQSNLRAFPTLPADLTRFAPIMGCINPYPPYGTPDKAFLNAVSGDFDLYAAWPGSGRNVSPLESLVRANEQISPTASALLGPVLLKPFARCLTANPNVIIEFIVANPVEHPELGNINPLVKAVAEYLNAQIYYYYNNPNAQIPSPVGYMNEAVNAAFHSDEGGRLKTKDMDLPVAMFVPEQFEMTAQLPNAQAAPLRAMLVSHCTTFLQAIMAFRTLCLVPVQAAWFAVLMEEAASDWNSQAMGAMMQELVLGPRPQNGYSNAQINAYAGLRRAFTNIFGVYDGKADGTGGEFPAYIGPVQTAADLANLLAPFDALTTAPQ